LDPSLSEFLDSIQPHCPDVFDFLTKKYASTSRDIRGTADAQGRIERHLILFNSNHQDLLTHFRHVPGKDKGEMRLEVFVVRREVLRTNAEQQHEIEQLEFQQANEIITSVSYFLWTRLLRE